MKTWLVLALACFLTLTGCGTGEDRSNTGEGKTDGARGQEALILDGIEEREEGAPVEHAQVSVARVPDTAETEAALSPEDADRAAKLLEKEGWKEGTADCLNDCVLTVNGARVYYDSGCGTFNDAVNQRSLKLTKEEQDAINVVLGKYITLGLEIMEETWGVTLSAGDVTPTGLTLVFTQSGGAPTGELLTGSFYWLESYNGGIWEAVPELPAEDGVDRAWISIAYLIPVNGSLEREVNWEYLYGELPTGAYRIGKEIMDFRGAGDYDERNYYAQFTIADS